MEILVGKPLVAGTYVVFH